VSQSGVGVEVKTGRFKAQKKGLLRLQEKVNFLVLVEVREQVEE
jgi:hypothetical protein